MKLNEVTTLKSQSILTESWSELTESQHRYLGRFERELWPLMEELKTVFEADLTADQIKNIANKYKIDEILIDLRNLASKAGVSFVMAEIEGINLKKKKLLLVFILFSIFFR